VAEQNEHNVERYPEPILRSPGRASGTPRTAAFCRCRSTIICCCSIGPGGSFAPDKRGAIPAELRPILQRLAINAETWPDTVHCFGRWFHRAVGRLSSMAARARLSGRLWFQGVRFSELAFD
jgi:hypothetical protein